MSLGSFSVVVDIVVIVFVVDVEISGAWVSRMDRRSRISRRVLYSRTRATWPVSRRIWAWEGERGVRQWRDQRREVAVAEREGRWVCFVRVVWMVW